MDNKNNKDNKGVNKITEDHKETPVENRDRKTRRMSRGREPYRRDDIGRDGRRGFRGFGREPYQKDDIDRRGERGGFGRFGRRDDRPGFVGFGDKSPKQSCLKCTCTMCRPSFESNPHVDVDKKEVKSVKKSVTAKKSRKTSLKN